MLQCSLEYCSIVDLVTANYGSRCRTLMSDVPVIPLVDIGATDVAVLDGGPVDWMRQAAGRCLEVGR